MKWSELYRWRGYRSRLTGLGFEALGLIEKSDANLSQCEMRPSHASAKYLTGAVELPKAVRKEKWQKGLLVKGRNEPVAIVHVAHVLAKIKDVSVEDVSKAYV